MMQTVFLILLIQLAVAVYDHRPGERYQTMLPNLKSEQQAQLKRIIYDQTQTKGQVFENVKKWISNQPPNVQYQFIRAQIDFKQKDDARNLALNAVEKMVSQEARAFNQHIRGIYDDQFITDRQTCEAVSNAISSTTDAIRQELNIAPMNCARVFETLAH
ncbi:hypothetical protein M3Y97_00527400 [Aphelenchoides bicaudatus]|nr:hypothetical protein M3Y97_00527400 [Aphelenchoides bicaudatus]